MRGDPRKETQFRWRWDTDRDRVVLEDLGKFKARAVGSRIRNLLLLGLEAEKRGLRLSDDGELHDMSGSQPVARAAGAGPSPPIQHSGRDEAHQKGLEAVLDGFGLEFDPPPHFPARPA